MGQKESHEKGCLDAFGFRPPNEFEMSATGDSRSRSQLASTNRDAEKFHTAINAIDTSIRRLDAKYTYIDSNIIRLKRDIGRARYGKQEDRARQKAKEIIMRRRQQAQLMDMVTVMTTLKLQVEQMASFTDALAAMSEYKAIGQYVSTMIEGAHIDELLEQLSENTAVLNTAQSQLSGSELSLPDNLQIDRATIEEELALIDAEERVRVQREAYGPPRDDQSDSSSASRHASIERALSDSYGGGRGDNEQSTGSATGTLWQTVGRVFGGGSGATPNGRYQRVPDPEQESTSIPLPS